MKQKICLDCDGVILSHHKTIEYFVKKELNIETEFDASQLDDSLNITYKCFFNISDDIPISLKKTIKKFNSYINNLYIREDFWENNIPMVSKEFFNKLNDLYDIYIVTGIKEKFKEHRIKNLFNLYGIDFTNKIFCTNGMFNDKTEIINRINPILYADDVMLHLIKLTNTNISLYYIDNFNKFNVYKNKYNISNIIRLNSLEELQIEHSYKLNIIII